MIRWYKDENCAIFFSEEPDIDFRYPSPLNSDKLNKKIIEKPFLLKNKVTIALFDFKKRKRYVFTPKLNYDWDGASIPQWAWAIIGGKTDPRFAIPSLVHDLMCENHQLVCYDRYFADKIFERLLYVSKVPAIKRWAMFHAVDNYQKTQGWGHNE